MEVVRLRGVVGVVVEDGKTSSGGMFSPRVRESLANFLRFSSTVRTWGGRGEVVVIVDCMLKLEDVGERAFEALVTAGLEGFILAVRGTGSDRS